jgi:hypothetical protein
VSVRTSAIHVTNVLRVIVVPLADSFARRPAHCPLSGKYKTAWTWDVLTFADSDPYKETGPRETPFLPGSLVDRTNVPKNISNATGDRLQTDSKISVLQFKK